MTTVDYGDMPMGLSDIKVTNIAGSTQADLPAAQTLKFTERVVSAELRGDGKTIAVVSEVDAVEWELEAGGIPIDAYALMTGRTVITSGTTPGRDSTLTGAGAERLPYFKLYGKSLGDGTDDVHVKLFKCKLTKPMEGEFKDGEFFVTACSGIAIDDGTNGIYDIVMNETAAALPAT